MKKWTFQVRSNPTEITQKLESSFRGTDRFALDMDTNKKDEIRFKLRKRISVAFDNNSQNRIIVNGAMFKADNGNGADVAISFAQHPLLKFFWYGVIILGLGFLVALFFKSSDNLYVFIAGGILIAVGVSFKLHHQKEFEKNVQEYKTMIARILEI